MRTVLLGVTFVVIVLGLAVVLARFLIGWSLSLPLVIFAGALVTVFEAEVIGVDEGDQAGGVVALVAAGIDAGEVDPRATVGWRWRRRSRDRPRCDDR